MTLVHRLALSPRCSTLVKWHPAAKELGSSKVLWLHPKRVKIPWSELKFNKSSFLWSVVGIVIVLLIQTAQLLKSHQARLL